MGDAARTPSAGTRVAASARAWAVGRGTTDIHQQLPIGLRQHAIPHTRLRARPSDGMHLSLEVGISETLLALDIAQLRPPVPPHSADPEKDPPSTPGSLPRQHKRTPRKAPATATSTPAVDVTRLTIRPRPDASRAAPAAHQPGFSSSKDVAARRQLLSWFPRDAGPSAPLPRDAQARQVRSRTTVRD